MRIIFFASVLLLCFSFYILAKYSHRKIPSLQLSPEDEAAIANIRGEAAQFIQDYDMYDMGLVEPLPTEATTTITRRILVVPKGMKP